MGRSLRRRMVGARLDRVVAMPATRLLGDPDSAAVVLPMVPPEMWTTPPGVRDEWFSCIAAAGARGVFLAVLTIWVVTGTVAA